MAQFPQDYPQQTTFDGNEKFLVTDPDTGDCISWASYSDILAGAPENSIDGSSIKDLTIQAKELDLPYGRIYYSTFGSAGGQVFAANSTNTMLFNTLDPDSKYVTLQSPGLLKVEPAGAYTVSLQMRCSDAPSGIQSVRIDMSSDGGSSFGIVGVRTFNFADQLTQGYAHTIIVNAPANAVFRGVYINSDNQTRLAASNAGDQKYTCSLAVKI